MRSLVVLVLEDYHAECLSLDRHSKLKNMIRKLSQETEEEIEEIIESVQDTSDEVEYDSVIDEEILID